MPTVTVHCAGETATVTYGAPPSPSTKYPTLAFFDDFHGTALDGEKWNVNQYALTYEMSESVARNVVVNDGLAMWTRKETSPKGKPWTSSYIDTRGKFEQRFGYFEVNVWIPAYAGTSAGLWEAPLWLRSLDGTPGEIDVFESWGDPHNGYTTQTYPSGGGFCSLLADTQHHDNRKSTITVKPATGRLSDGFHRIGLEWSPAGFQSYLDGKPTGTFIPASGLGVVNGSGGNTTAFDMSVFGPMHLRVQRQVGQLKNLYPDLAPGYWGVPDANTQPGSAMKIRHVAVYR